MCLALEEQGVEVEVHHHEVAAPGQCEIGTKFAPLVQRADWMQILKYTVHNVAHSYGKTATFMPKPIVGDNGSGMHVHQSVWKGGENLFAGNGYAGLVRVRAVLHRRHHQARQGAERDHQSRNQLLQASGARLRSADQSGVLGAQPLGFDPHPVRVEPEGAPYRSALPGSDRESVPGLLRHADGRPGRRAEQDSSGRPDRQEPVRPAAGRGQEGAQRVLVAGPGAGECWTRIASS